jgi:hypothetical protein
MSQHYVRFLEADELVICSEFDGPQDIDFIPFQGVVEDDDPRYITFLSTLNPLPDPTVVNSAKLQQLNQLAAAQKKALTDRIGTLQDAVDNIGVEGMEEYAATPAEEAELPVRKAQYTKWKNYAIALGRVTQQTGWPATVNWPVQPATGMDLSVSSMAPETV